MKRNAIARIVFYSLAILLLTGVLLVGLVFNTDGIGGIEDNRNYLTGAGSVETGLVSKVDIQWTSGKVNIIAGNTKTITFTESGSTDTPLAYAVEGGTLFIRFQKPRFSIGSFIAPEKELTVTVPKFWVGNYTINVASAEVYAYDLIAYSLGLNSASGECKFVSCSVETAAFDIASGSVYYTGTMDALNCNAASASFVGIFDKAPNLIRMDSASGNLDITLPQNSGFRATLSENVKLISDFSTRYKDGAYEYIGKDTCIVDYRSTSGKAFIRQNS